MQTMCTSTSINRNIVECKADEAKKVLEIPIVVLIETLWNVKMFLILH